MSKKDETSIFAQIFDRVEFKKITKTDKRKSAIVSLKAMRDLLEDAGIVAETETEKKYTSRNGKMLDGTRIKYTYYNSTRDLERLPEARIGKSDLLKRVEIGDLFYVLKRKDQIYFHVKKAESETAELNLNIAEEAAVYLLDEKDLFRRARASKHRKAKRIGGSSQFIRDPNVTAFIKKASDRKCQMPGCISKPFQTKSGERYIEVHHIIPLSEGGDDRIENCIALCPRCHRLLHHGKSRMKFRRKAAKKMERICLKWEEEFT